MVRIPRLPPPNPQPPPPTTFPRQEEERATQVTGEFEVFVDGKLIHSKKVILGSEDRDGVQEGDSRSRGEEWDTRRLSHIWTLFPPYPER